MRKILLLLTLITGIVANGQELNVTVNIDAEQTGQQNLQVFRSLKQQMTEFLQNRVWTKDNYLNQERIDCNFTLIVSSYDGNSFNGSLQVQASRPVFNSTYNSPIYNYNDRQVSFEYVEFEPFIYNINSFESNLISILAFHAYAIIGLDASSFELNGGNAYFEIANQITNTASSSGFPGWNATDGTQSRFRFIDALISPVYKEYHITMYQYHREGLDLMSENPKEAKLRMIESLKSLKSINDRRPNSYILRTFFDAKVDEISAIFKDGPQIDTSELIESLNRMAPTRRTAWEAIN